MDISPPLSTSDAQTAFAASDLFARMLQDTTAAIPVGDLDTPLLAQRHEDARTMAAALHPPTSSRPRPPSSQSSPTTLRSPCTHAQPSLARPPARPRLCRVALAEHRAYRAGVTDLAKRHAPADPPRQRTERFQSSSIEPKPTNDDPIPSAPAVPAA
jgi:hypothetical protein